MIIKFSNLGSIKETELDLRPLTVIIGPNNSNKTYIAYSVYGLWKLMGSFSGLRIRFRKQKENVFSAKIDDDFFHRTFYNLSSAIKLFNESLGTFFQDSSERLFSNTTIELSISHDEIREGIHRVISQKDLQYIKSTDLFWSLKENNLYVQIKSPELLEDFKKRQLADSFFTLLPLHLHTTLFSDPFLLPAERNAFVLTYKLLANRRYKLMKEVRRGGRRIERRQYELLKEQGDTLYPQPIEDFWDFLTDLEFNTNARMEPEQKNEFQLLADDIEEYIQNKNKTVLVPTQLGGKEIRVNVKKGLSIDLYNASSSIKQLAPLLLYLRYRAAENDLLIIDEPELGLHPESQAKMLEALAILVNFGVKVLLTTHSPYFIAHLNNLLAGESENPSILKKQASHLYMKDARAFLREDQVSAYEMQDHKEKGHKLCSLKDDYENFGIRWGSLSDVSADLQQKFFEISEKKETVSHG